MSLREKKGMNLPKEENIWIDDQGRVRTGSKPAGKLIEKTDDSYRLVGVTSSGDVRDYSTGKLISKGDIGSRIKILRSALDGYERRIKTEPERLGAHHFREIRNMFNEISKIDDSRADDLKRRIPELKKMLDELEVNLK